MIINEEEIQNLERERENLLWQLSKLEGENFILRRIVEEKLEIDLTRKSIMGAQ
jgi:hypothetical protein